MKKFVMGVIIGALLTIGATAAADSISKIGKTITNEYTVKVNGSPLDVTAIAVDGTSYAPVRAIAGAAGYDVDFQNDEVLLTSSVVGAGESVVPEGEGEVSTDTETVEERIEWLNKMMQSYRINNASLEYRLGETTDEAEKNEIQSWIDYHNKLIAEVESELAELGGE